MKLVPSVTLISVALVASVTAILTTASNTIAAVRLGFRTSAGFMRRVFIGFSRNG